MEKTKKLSIANFCVTSFAALVFICFQLFSLRVFGLWQAWHLTGYGFLFLVGPAAILASLIFLVLVCSNKPQVKFIIANGALLALNVSMVVCLWTIYELTTWS